MPTSAGCLLIMYITCTYARMHTRAHTTASFQDILSKLVPESQTVLDFDAAGNEGIRFVGGDDVTGALHVL